MKMNNKIINVFFDRFKSIRRKSWPEGDYIIADGASNSFWYYSSEQDDFSDFTFGFSDLGANDWEIAG